MSASLASSQPVDNRIKALARRVVVHALRGTAVGQRAESQETTALTESAQRQPMGIVGNLPLKKAFVRKPSFTMTGAARANCTPVEVDKTGAA